MSDPFFSASLPIFDIVIILILAIPVGVYWYTIMVLNYIFFFFFFSRFYSLDTERSQVGTDARREGKADSLLSRELDVGLDP